MRKGANRRNDQVGPVLSNPTYHDRAVVGFFRHSVMSIFIVTFLFRKWIKSFSKVIACDVTSRDSTISLRPRNFSVFWFGSPMFCRIRARHAWSSPNLNPTKRWCERRQIVSNSKRKSYQIHTCWAYFTIVRNKCSVESPWIIFNIRGTSFAE